MADSTIDSENATPERTENDQIGEEAKLEAPEENVNQSYNLSIDDTSNIEPELISAIRGDAIGNTLYSEKFVLKTLLELKNFTQTKLTTEFEKDLCFLWDMTIEKDVVKLLLHHNCLDLFTSIIEISEDERLIEILLGIIGNMSIVAETRGTMCCSPQIMSIILDQLSSPDPLILLQFMRLLYSSIIFENSGDELTWFDHFKNSEDFVEKFAFILASSTSNTLLTSSLEALNGLCAKFTVIEIQPESKEEKDTSFCQMFVKEQLIQGIIEAFKQIVPEIQETDLNDETSIMPSENVAKVMNLFLEINVILTQYEKASELAYKNLLPDFFKCISRILFPITKKICLFPINHHSQGIIENINDIFQALSDPFNGQCFHQIITIWYLIEEYNRKKIEDEKKKSEWDEDSDESNEVIDVEDISMTLLEFITRMAFKSSQLEFIDSVKQINSKSAIKSLYRRIDGNSEEPEIKSLSDKLKHSLKTIWHVDV
jgi:hypothetical protein